MARKRVPKAVQELLDALKEQKIRVEETKDGYRAFETGGTRSVLFHLTESDRKAMNNTISRLRRICGFQWKGR